MDPSLVRREDRHGHVSEAALRWGDLMPTDDHPTATALVVLPFETPEQAETFAALVITQMPGTAAPFVLHGTAYEYRRADNDEQGQVIEIFPASNFDVFIGAEGERHHVLQRITGDPK